MSARFARGCVASPDRTATEAGAAVLAEGGNALDAALAANLALGVVAPHLCGYGGDVLAIVWDGVAHGYLGIGRAGAAARAGGDAMPERGPATVTVPGAVAGWFDLHERFASLPFERLAAPALSLARDGFVVSEQLARAVVATAALGPDQTWRRAHEPMRSGERVRLPELERTIETLVRDGRDGFYRGEPAAAIAAVTQLEPADLAAHGGAWVEPLRAPFAGWEVLELPPPSQGATALQMLRMAEALGPGDDHQRIEIAKLALADRDEHLGDPDAMRIDACALFGDEQVARAAALVDPARARPVRAAPRSDGGTAYLCAADARGMMVSLIQSNFAGFGSLVSVPGWGINLHNRGACFVLTPGHPNELAPGKRPLHTLIPALVLRDGRAAMVIGSMGGHGQAQFHLQLLERIARGEDLQAAIDAPRWIVSHTDGRVSAEPGFGPAWFEDLRARGHIVTEVEERSSLLGHAHAIARDGTGYAGATDPRAQGAVLGS